MGFASPEDETQTDTSDADSDHGTRSPDNRMEGGGEHPVGWAEEHGLRPFLHLSRRNMRDMGREHPIPAADLPRVGRARLSLTWEAGLPRCRLSGGRA
jgi:hypothetical protein